MADRGAAIDQPELASTDAVIEADEIGTNADGKPILRQNVLALQALVPAAFDEVALAYTGDDLTTVTYKLAGVTVATLTLGYTGTNLTSITRA